MAFGKAQEKITSDASDALYGYIWDLTILEFLINLHSKRNETTKRQEAVSLIAYITRMHTCTVFNFQSTL